MISVGPIFGARHVAAAGVALSLAGCAGSNLLGSSLSSQQNGVGAKVTEACKRSAEPYYAARKTYNRKRRAYWRKVDQKKNARRRKARASVVRADYVLTHPPKYDGPSRPKCLDVAKKKAPPAAPSTIPVVKDFLGAAKRQYGFVPTSTNEKAFKQSYAREALAKGLTEEQVVGVYALETGGIGPYYRQSGIFPVDYQCRKITPKGRPASTALGYAQLLAANSNVVMHKHGSEFARRLRAMARQADDKRRKALLAKASVVQRMARDIGSGIRRYKSRNNWREYVSFGKTPKGRAVHAINLDADVGPWLQVHKLKLILEAASKRGLTRPSAAQLELLNLVGYGRGLEMLSGAARTVPTANFFSESGYNANPVAKDITSKQLVEKLGSIIAKRRQNCGAVEFVQVFRALGG